MRVIVQWIIFYLLLINIGFSQKNIRGFIYDKKTNLPIPYATIQLKNTTLGTLSNHDGYFDFVLPELAKIDSVIFSYMGYTSVSKSINEFSITQNIYLSPIVIQLNEVKIRPLQAVDYVIRAVEKIPDNYMQSDYVAQCYFREQIKENELSFAMYEAIVETYNFPYTDTSKALIKVLQGKSKNDIHTSQVFKSEKEINELSKKERKKYISMDNSEEDDNESIEKIIDELDGPNIIFNINPIKTLPDFLQAHNMKRYTYNFGKTVRLNNKNILVIHFEQKKTEEHQKSNGVIYIDEISLAIVRIEENLHIKIPAMLKPIIFAAGYKIENPWMKLLFEYREHDKIWIPSQANVKINFKMEKIKLFTKNIIAHYYVEKLFITNEIKLQNISPFPKEVCVKQNSSFKKQLPPYNEDAWKKYNSIYMRNP